MSQVTFKTTYDNKPVEVLAGWDRPLKEFFLTVLRLEDSADDDGDEAIWSTIYYPSKADKTGTEHLRAKLVEMSISAPPGFWDRVERKEGNVVYRWRGEEFARQG